MARRVLRLDGPPGGLFGIDQEVVTLRGLYGNSGSRRDLNAGRIDSKLTGSVRAVAPGGQTRARSPA